MGVVFIQEALKRADNLGLDLVKISPTEWPPICRIMDYGRYKYKLKRKYVEMKKKIGR